MMRILRRSTIGSVSVTPGVRPPGSAAPAWDRSKGWTSTGRGEPMNVPKQIANGAAAPGTENDVLPSVVVRPVFRSRPSISIGPRGGSAMIWERRSTVNERRGAVATEERRPNSVSAYVSIADACGKAVPGTLSSSACQPQPRPRPSSIR